MSCVVRVRKWRGDPAAGAGAVGPGVEVSEGSFGPLQRAEGLALFPKHDDLYIDDSVFFVTKGVGLDRHGLNPYRRVLVPFRNRGSGVMFKGIEFLRLVGSNY